MFPSFGSLCGAFVTMKASVREEAFRSVPAQGPLGPVLEVHAHAVFSNGNLPSRYGGEEGRVQPKAITIAYNGLGVCWTAMINN